MVIRFDETYKTAAISTCHMTETDSKQLSIIAQEDCSMVAVRPTGFFVKLFDGEQEPQSNAREELSDSLNALLIEAARQGFRCIEFDCDADEVEGATQFEW